MALVVDGVCRYTFEGFYIDRPWVNICDMRLETTGSLVDRNDYIYDTAGHLINAWATHLTNAISDSLVLNQVSWVDLDSETGSTGTRTETSEFELPDAGHNDGAPVAGNVSILVTKQTTGGRGQRNGRWYQAGLVEANVDGNGFQGIARDAYQGNFNGFLDMVNDDGVLPSPHSRHMVVVHTTGENPQTGTYSRVTALTVSDRLATQRRRLRA